jgi:hypothetical protein
MCSTACLTTTNVDPQTAVTAISRRVATPLVDSRLLRTSSSLGRLEWRAGRYVTAAVAADG